ncbi:MAG: alkylation response protein AidB-like acyl-CoA dehydrogenase [bacterium]|jgi:alkylation response protein AidB-like acyl-CoA dehydrogenase
MAARIPEGAEFLFRDITTEEIFTPEDFTTEQKAILETTEKFIETEVAPLIEEMEKGDYSVSAKLMKKAGELGLLALDAPEEYDGLELDKATSMIAAEKVASGASFATTYMAHTGIGTLPVLYFGTKEQKDKYLAKLASGEFIGAYCLTEPGSGSDALGASTYATLSDDGKYWLLNGTKQFITNGSFADVFTVFAKIDKEHFTGFLVDKDTEGLTVGPEEKKMGIKGSSTTQIILENAKVPVENLLGEKGKGHKIAFNVLNIGRFKLGAATIGVSKEALVEAVKYSNARKQFGKKINSFGAIQEKIADSLSLAYAGESLVYRLAGLLDDRLATVTKDTPNYYDAYLKGIEEFSMECAISKVFCSEVAAKTADEVLQIFGGYGFVTEYPAERYYRDERINRLYEGTNEINRLLIPGTIFKRGMQGLLPLMEQGKVAVKAFTTEKPAQADDSVFGKEDAILKNLKTLALAIHMIAGEKFGANIGNEQEAMLALADISIQIVTFESALQRAKKMYDKASDEKKKLLSAVVEVAATQGLEVINRSANKLANFVAEGEKLDALLDGIYQWTKFRAPSLLVSKRLLATTMIAAERYIF